MKYIFYFLLLTNIGIAVLYGDSYFFAHKSTNNPSIPTTHTQTQTKHSQVMYDCLHITNVANKQQAYDLVKYLHGLDIRARIISTAHNNRPSSIQVTVAHQYVSRIKEQQQPITTRFANLILQKKLGTHCALGRLK